MKNKKVQKKVNNLFNFQTTGTQGIYTILKTMFEFIFIETSNPVASSTLCGPTVTSISENFYLPQYHECQIVPNYFFFHTGQDG